MTNGVDQRAAAMQRQRMAFVAEIAARRLRRAPRQGPQALAGRLPNAIASVSETAVPPSIIPRSSSSAASKTIGSRSRLADCSVGTQSVVRRTAPPPRRIGGLRTPPGGPAATSVVPPSPPVHTHRTRPPSGRGVSRSRMLPLFRLSASMRRPGALRSPALRRCPRGLVQDVLRLRRREWLVAFKRRCRPTAIIGASGGRPAWDAHGHVQGEPELSLSLTPSDPQRKSVVSSVLVRGCSTPGSPG